MWRGEPNDNDLADWRQGRLNLPPDHQSVPQSIYGAAHCWYACNLITTCCDCQRVIPAGGVVFRGESLARVYSRIGTIASRRPTPEQAFATGLGHPWEPAGTKTYVDPAGTVHVTEQKEEKDMVKTAELDMGWLITGQAADTHTAALERAAACVTGMWAPTPHVSRKSRVAVGGGVEIDRPLSCVAIRLGYRGFQQHDPWNAEHPSFGISELDCAQLFTKAIDVPTLIDPDSERNAAEIFFAVAHGVSRHKLSWLDLESTCKMFGYKPVDGTAFPRVGSQFFLESLISHTICRSKSTHATNSLVAGCFLFSTSRQSGLSSRRARTKMKQRLLPRTLRCAPLSSARKSVHGRHGRASSVPAISCRSTRNRWVRKV